jgi:hypothetical protein
VPRCSTARAPSSLSAVIGQSPGLLLKRLLLLFWTMYFSMIALTNLVDLFGALNVFHWTFLDSGNFKYLLSTVKVYDLAPELTKVLLAGAFGIELVGAALFWRALLRFGARGAGRVAVTHALCWGTLVWIGFVFMTEFFVAYRSESVFRELLILMIVTVLTMALVPDDKSDSQPA